MSNSPRLQPPERLSGVPDAPVVEVAPERPWLTVAETNRLIRQQGLALAVAQAWVLDEIVQVIELPPEEEKQLVRQFVEAKGVSSDEALQAWLKQKDSDTTIFSISPRKRHGLNVGSCAAIAKRRKSAF